MNHRIQQMITEARKYAWENETDWSAGAERETLFEKKFAELMIKECVEIVSNSPVERGEEPNDLFVGYNMALDKAVEKINIHFGVEK